MERDEQEHPVGPSPGEVSRRAREINLLRFLMVCAVLVAIAAVFLPWWWFSGTTGLWSGASAFAVWGGCSGTLCRFWNFPALFTTFQIAASMFFIGTALAVTTLAMLFWPGAGARQAKGWFISGIAGSIMLLAGPVYLNILLPESLGAGVPNGNLPEPAFAGPAAGLVGWGGVTWGGGAGWYVALVASGLFLASTLVAFVLTVMPGVYPRRGRMPDRLPQTGLAESQAGPPVESKVRWAAAVGLFALGIALVLAGTILPWWTISDGHLSDQVWYLRLACSTAGSNGMCIVFSGTFAPLENGPLGPALIVMIAALVLSTLALGFSILARRRSAFGLLLVPTGLLAAFLAALAPAYVYFALPAWMYRYTGGFAEFFGSAWFGSWGAGTGWFASLVAAVILLASTVIASSAGARHVSRGPEGLARTPHESPSLRSSSDLKGRLGPSTVVCLIFLVVTAVLLALVLNSVWWIFEQFGAPVSFYLGFFCRSDGSCFSSETAVYPSEPFGVASAVIWVGFLLSVVCVADLILAVFRPRFGRVLPFAALAGSLFILGEAIDFFFATPAGYGSTLGPGIGWYLALVSVATFFTAGVSGVFALRRLRRLGDFRLPQEG